MFNRNIYMEEIDIIQATRLIVSVVSDEKYIHFRFYTSRLLPSDLRKGTWNRDDGIKEIGPKITMKIMRANIADDQLYKRSVKYKPYWAQKTVSIFFCLKIIRFLLEKFESKNGLFSSNGAV